MQARYQIRILLNFLKCKLHFSIFDALGVNLDYTEVNSDIFVSGLRNLKALWKMALQFYLYMVLQIILLTGN